MLVLRLADLGALRLMASAPGTVAKAIGAVRDLPPLPPALAAEVSEPGGPASTLWMGYSWSRVSRQAW